MVTIQRKIGQTDGRFFSGHFDNKIFLPHLLHRDADIFSKFEILQSIFDPFFLILFAREDQREVATVTPTTLVN